MLDSRRTSPQILPCATTQEDEPKPRSAGALRWAVGSRGHNAWQIICRLTEQVRNPKAALPRLLREKQSADSFELQGKSEDWTFRGWDFITCASPWPFRIPCHGRLQRLWRLSIPPKIRWKDGDSEKSCSVLKRYAVGLHWKIDVGCGCQWHSRQLTLC